MIDGGPEQDNLRTITFPSYTQYFVGVAGDYHFNISISIELLHGHVFSNPNIQNRAVVNINVDVIDLRLKVEA